MMLSASAIAAALADDATLSLRLVGTWHGGRHDTRYFSDGTWMMDPQNYELLGGQNTHGKWRIENGKLIETWRFKSESSDSSTVADIIELTATRFQFRTLSQDGPGRPRVLSCRAASTPKHGFPMQRYRARNRSNQALERTADRREDLLSMTSKLKSDAALALVSGRSACSR